VPDLQRIGEKEVGRRMRLRISSIRGRLFLERLPFGIGFHRGAAALAVAHVLVAPDMDDLVDRPDIGGEPADEIAEMADLQFHAFGDVGVEIVPQALDLDLVAALVENHGVFLQPAAFCAVRSRSNNVDQV
jgi:hypothetical protein